MEVKLSVSILNPNAPAFNPASTQRPNLHYPPPPPFPGAPVFSPAFPQNPKFYYSPPSPMFYFNNHTYELPFKKPFKAFTGNDVKPGKPFRWGFRRCLPPRHLKNFSEKPKNRNFSAIPKNRSFSAKPMLIPEDKLAGKTSVMIRNIPNCFGRNVLLKILDTHCRKHNEGAALSDKNRSSYDFVYLPMDFVKRANLGYAFVNFTSSIAAEIFRRDFDNFFWNNIGNKKKVCEITVAKFQGIKEFSQHFKHSRFICHTENYLPVVLSPPSDGFTAYKLTTLGDRVGLRDCLPRRA
ncbi:Protein terminal ear1 [Cardamine amara subsp. amara]|uniref:Protein terminal ear1 n=1 Tax=Cardamine amara subsp. amara TaxID=228776 RepID=A0ABD1C2S9_CARAN